MSMKTNNKYEVVPFHYTRALAVTFVPHFTAGRTSRLQRVRCYRYGGKAPYTPLKLVNSPKMDIKKNYAILTDNVINKNNLNKSEKNYYICKQNINVMNKTIKILGIIILGAIALKIIIKVIALIIITFMCMIENIT